MSGVRKLAGQTLAYGVSSVLTRLIYSLVLSFIYINYFTTDQFGLFSYFYSILSYTYFAFSFGMDSAYFKFTADREDNEERIYSNSYWVIVYPALIFVLVGLLFRNTFAYILGFPEHGTIVAYLFLLVLFDAAAGVPVAALRRHERLRTFLLVQISNMLLMLALNILFVIVFKWSIDAIFLANLIASGLRFVILSILLPPKFALPEWKTTLPMLRFGGMIMIAGLAGMVNEMADKNLVVTLWSDGKEFLGKPRTGTELNGIYNASYKFGMLLALVAQAFRYAAEPFFFRQASTKNSRELFAKVFHYFALLGLITTLFVSVFRHEIAKATFLGLLKGPLLPPDYWPGLDIIPIVLAANLFLSLYINLSIWFKLQGKPSWGLGFTLVGVVITLGLNFWGVPQYSFHASAWAHLVCYACMFWLCYAVGQRKYPIPYRIKRFCVYLLMVVAGVLVLEFSRSGYEYPTGMQVMVLVVCLTGIGLMERFFPVFRVSWRLRG